MRGVSLLQNGMNWSGVCRDEAILSTSDPPESLSPVPPLNYFSNPSMHSPGRPLPFREDEGDSDQRQDPHQNQSFHFCCFIVVTIARKMSLQIVLQIRSFEARILLFTDAEARHFVSFLSRSSLVN